MAANGVNKVNSKELAQAGISYGDVVWLKSMRNSPVCQTPIYQSTLAKVRSFAQNRRSGMLAAAA